MAASIWKAFSRISTSLQTLRRFSITRGTTEQNWWYSVAKSWISEGKNVDNSLIILWCSMMGFLQWQETTGSWVLCNSAPTEMWDLNVTVGTRLRFSIVGYWWDTRANSWSYYRMNGAKDKDNRRLYLPEFMGAKLEGSDCFSNACTTVLQQRSKEQEAGFLVTGVHSETRKNLVWICANVDLQPQNWESRL